MKPIRIQFLISVSLILTACGGGSSPAPTVPVVVLPVVPPVPVPPPLPPTPPTTDPEPGPPPTGLVLIAGGIDSLTFGQGRSWLDYFVSATRGGLGNGGPGYQNFSQVNAGRLGAQLTMTGDVADFAAENLERRYSIDGFGLGLPSGHSGSFTWRPASYWTRARISFLRQPGGGRMRCGNGRQVDTARIPVDTAAAEFGLGFVDVAFASGTDGDRFGCSQMTGPLAVFGALATRGNGITNANWSEGGRRLTFVANQDSTLRRQWFAELKPTYYFLTGGLNGVGVDPQAQQEAELRTIVGDIRAGSPTTIIYIVQYNTFAGLTATSLDSEAALRKRLAAELGARFIDNRDVLGSYEAALAAGYMRDNIHLSDLGYERVARYYVETLGLSTSTPDPGPTPYPPAS